MSELTALFDEHDKNWSWFEKHYDELVKKFGGEFVAVHEKRVIDHDKELSALMKRIESKYPADCVFVDFVSSEKLTLIL
ncbi:MAG: DUF5678 domain-containing protein [Nitrososphaeria archaeon]